MSSLRDSTLLAACLATMLPAAEPVRPQDVRELSVEQAKQIIDDCRGKGSIVLEALQSLSAEAAAELARHGEHLTFAALPALSAEAAALLANRPEGGLTFRGMRSLSPEVARALVPTRGPLGLDGLESISAEVAAPLAAYRGPVLSLAGLTSLSAETAAALTTCPTWDGHLSSIRTLPVETARVLARHRGQQLVLAGLTTISPEAIEALSGYTGGRLHMMIQPLTPELVATLAACRAWQPATETLATLTAESARVLVSLPQWNGNLQGVTAIESPDAVEIARQLARRQGPLSLPRLRRLSPRTLLALIEKDDVLVPLVEDLLLIPEPDGSPTDDPVLPEKFLERQEQQRHQVQPRRLLRVLIE